ncbi:phage tail tape measure protein, TP901 family, core region, partial [Flexibacter flexilis DSM 6793]
MASTTQAQSQITVITDAKQSINELGRLQLKAADFAKEIKDSKKSFDEFNRSSTALSRMGEGIKRLSIEAAQFKQAMTANKTAAEQFSKSTADLGKVNTELKNLKSQAAELRTAIKGMKEGTEEYARENDKLTAIKTKIESLKTSATALKAQMLESKNAAKDFDKANAGLDKTNATLTKLTAKADDLAAATLRAKAEADKYSAAKEGFKAVNAEIDKEREKLGVLGMTMNQMLKYQKDLNAAINTGAVYGTERYQQLNTKLVEVNGAIQQQKNDQKRLQQETGLTVGSLRELEEQEKRLNAEIKNLGINTKEFAAKARELRTVESQISSAENKLKGFAGSWANMKNSIMNVAGGVIGGTLALSAFQKLAEFIPNLISSQAKLSDSFADIRKTTNMSIEGVKEYNKQLSQLNTRTATEELRKISIIAGQLGIDQTKVFDFTAAVDKMVVALGDEFTGGAEQITKEMGALRNIFSDIKTDKIDEDMLRIGNAINQLGSEGAATGPVMADFASRIGGVGVQLGLSSGQILGLSATLQELNVNAERGGTAIVKILQRMASTPEEFAKVAQMSAKSFTELVDNDIYGALTRVIEKANESGASATVLASILKELDVDGAGASEVFAKLGGNMDTLAKKVASSNSALKSTDSIMNEFGIKNENFAAKLEKLSKAISKMFTFPTLNKAIEDTVGWLYKLLPATEKFSASLEKEAYNLDSATIGIMSLKVGTEERTRAIKELQDKYPDYLGNLNAETVSNAELKKSIDNVTNSLIEQIIIKKAMEKVDEQANKAAEAYANLMEKRRVVQDRLNDYFNQEKGNTEKHNQLQSIKNQLMASGMSLEKQYEFIQSGRVKELPRWGDAYHELAGSVMYLRIAEQDYNKEAEKTLQFEKERTEVYKSLGRNANGETPAEIAARKKAEEDAKRKEEEDKLKAAAARKKAREEAEKKERDDNAKKNKAEAEKRAKEALEAERKIIDLRLNLLKDERERKRAIATEENRREIQDFKMSAEDKAKLSKTERAKRNAQETAFEKLSKRKLDEELHQIDTEYYEKAREAYEKLQKEKVEAAKKAKQQELDDATAFAELQVLVTQKDTDVMGFEVQKSEGIIRELKRRKYAELENTELTQEQRLAITQRYDKQINAVEVAGRATNVEAQIGLLNIQMQKELAKEELTENEKYNIQAKYIDKINQLLDEQEKQEQENIKNKVIGFVDAFKTIMEGINELNAIEIDNQFIELDKLKQYQDQQYENNKQRLGNQLAQEEAAKNAR